MIISRSPVRITLGGGGTDLPSYYSKHGGALIAAAIDKYTLVTAHTRFDDDIKLNYSRTEQIKNVDEIKHNIFREGLRLLNIEKGIELTSLSDMPSSSGLGTSGSFTIALLNVLHTYKKEFVSQKQLAEEGCKIEIDILKEPIGKQDQYIAAFGGITSFQFSKEGTVTVEALKMSDEAQDELQNNILLFYTGISRSASQILREQDDKSKKEEGQTIDTLHEIKRIGLETKKSLEQGNIDKLGEYLDEHWNIKKKLSKSISNPYIDECYNFAKENGALGGKIMGAGGGGFFMFYHNGSNTEKTSFIKKMATKNLKKMRFDFDTEGSKIILNMKNI
ncbi:MAG: GHMP family kinase ATP-binding protein [Promethearchaeota archaeon]|jgi:D-glycero-alpha-D-manno-heptose-7-phosphate kinase